MHVLNLKGFNLYGKERRKLGEYARDTLGGRYDPKTSAVSFRRKLTQADKKQIVGFIAGMDLANLWADEDGDVEIEDNGGDDAKS